MVRYFGSYKINLDETLDIRVGTNPIPDDMWAEYERVTAVLAELHPIISSFECATRNGVALLAEVAALHERVQTNHVRASWHVEFVAEASFALSQRVSNFVSSLSACVDHTRSHLKKTYGKASRQFQAFEADIARLSATQFSFRFIGVLRNYTVHQGIPVSNVNLNATRDAGGAFRLHFVFSVERDAILRNASRKITPDLRREIEALDPYIDLLPLLEQQMEWNRELFGGIIQREQARLLECSRYFKILRERLGFPEDEVWVIWVRDQVRSGPPTSHTPIPFGTLEWITRLLIARGPSSPIPRG